MVTLRLSTITQLRNNITVVQNRIRIQNINVHYCFIFINAINLLTTKFGLVYLDENIFLAIQYRL